jgi:YARHG domain
MFTANRIPAIRMFTAAAMSAALAGSASAGCFESGIGCSDSQLMPYSALRQLSCDALWNLRNTIYYENGYCFKTARARAVFDNASCLYNSASQVPLNDYEVRNIDRIVRIEKEMHC